MSMDFQPSHRKKSLNIAVCAICRNEVDYIEEWVAFYQDAGFDSIYVYDNVSDDGSTELLAALDDAGIVKRVHWPRRDDIPPQRDAYGDFLNRFAFKHDYVLICDLDEFLVITDKSVKGFIREAEAKHGNVGAIAFPWLIFGAGESETQNAGLVIERFVQCENKPVRTVKTMYRSSNVYNMRTHICDLLGGVYLDNQMEVAKWDQRMPIKLQATRAAGAVMHHYYTKSRDEWVRRRRQPKADRAHIEVKDLLEFEKYKSLPGRSAIDTDKILRVKEKIAANAQVLEISRARVNDARIHLIAVNGDWIFAHITGLNAAEPVGVRLSGDNGHEEVFYTKPRSNSQHVLTIKTKWREFYSDFFRLSILGATSTAAFKYADFPTSESSFFDLMKYMPEADEHIFNVFLSALKDENFTYLVEHAGLLVSYRNKKFELVIAALGRFAASGDRAILKSECSAFDSDFIKKISSKKGAPLLSHLLK